MQFTYFIVAYFRTGLGKTGRSFYIQTLCSKVMHISKYCSYVDSFLCFVGIWQFLVVGFRNVLEYSLHTL